MVKRNLLAFQRMMFLMMSRACRTTSIVAMQVILDCKPMDLETFGAWNEMKKITTFLKANHQVISKHAITEGIAWHFMPPSCPSLRRTMGTLRQNNTCCGRNATNIRRTLHRPDVGWIVHELSPTATYVSRSYQFESFDSWTFPDPTPAHRAPMSWRHRRQN